ncbi:MAG: TetR/AcrR family transcriptional regulator [Thermoleophilaceae bacterium]|nr:TetR/AcrR family transcriptional regulator [Thermoleophilaceae bacterium]
MTGAPTHAGPRSSRREERKAANRAKLLAAARKVFSEKGVGAATARDIVRETDLASGTFYNYFRDKDDAFRALVEELAAKARAAVSEQRRSPGRTLEERIEGAYRAYFELVCEERELFVMVRRNAGALGSLGVEPLLEGGIRDLVLDLADWEEAGELPAVDLDYLATAMVGAGHQIATHLIDRDPPDVDAAARFCTRLFLGGIRGLSG